MDATTAARRRAVPLADPSSSPAIPRRTSRRAHKALSDFAKKNRDEADAAARAGSRAARATVYDRGGVPTSRRSRVRAAPTRAARDAETARPPTTPCARSPACPATSGIPRCDSPRSKRSSTSGARPRVGALDGGLQGPHEGTAVFGESTPQSRSSARGSRAANANTFMQLNGLGKTGPFRFCLTPGC